MKKFIKYCRKCGSKCNIEKTISSEGFNENTGKKEISYDYLVRCPNWGHMTDFMWSGWHKTHTSDWYADYGDGVPTFYHSDGDDGM